MIYIEPQNKTILCIVHHLFTSPHLLDEVLDSSELVLRQEPVPLVRDVVGAAMHADQDALEGYTQERLDLLRRSGVEIHRAGEVFGVVYVGLGLF